jgi:outer membrane receptor protein involved in Fe transport
MKNCGKYLLVVLAALLFAAGTWAQGPTGSIEGTVVDEKGGALPGVSVEISSPNLQGTKVATTDFNGRFRVILLPPGEYMARFTLASFSGVEQSAITVGLGRTVTLNVQMRSAFKEEVVVSGSAPTIDVKSAEAGANITKEYFSKLALGRTYLAVVQMAPGANLDSNGNVTLYGSGGAENSYYIDGVDTTEIEYGRAGKALNQEFIQEEQIKTGGYNAEYGRSTGGVIIVVTKSGGNEFHGDVFGYYDSDKWQAYPKNDVVNYRTLNAGSSYSSGYNRQDYGVDLGGYLMKDTLWFFAAYDRVAYVTNVTVTKDFTSVGGPPLGKVYDQDDDRNLWSGKLTWRIGQNHSIVASAFGDPRTRSGAGVAGQGLAGPETHFMADIASGGTDWSAKYEGVLGTHVVVSAQATQHKEKTDITGPGFGIPEILDYTSLLYAQTGTAITTGGLGFIQGVKNERDDYRADLSWFVNNFGGDHEFKVGYEWEHVPIVTNTYHSGGDLMYKRCLPGHFITGQGCDSAANTYYWHEVYLNAWPPGGAQSPIPASYIVNPLSVNSKTDSYATFIQDTWRVGKNLSLDLGVRYEEQKLYNLFGSVSAHLKNEWAPRLGFVWDWKGDGTSKLFGSFGRFYETIPTDMVSRAFGGEISTLMVNQSLTSVSCDPTFYNAWVGKSANIICRIVGPQSMADLEPVDPNLKGQFVDHYQIGVEFQVGKDIAVGASLIYRNLGSVIEDALSPDGNYYIGNPGSGLLTQSVTQDYKSFLPAPTATRTFKGFELTARKRFSNNWQLMASYLYSKLEGRYDGTFQYSTGQLDPNINSAYDYAEFQVHNKGLLSNDRTHQLKGFAAYSFDFGLTVGGDLWFQSGVPITAYGYDGPYRNWELYLSDRGAWGRTANQWEGDLHLGYPVKLAKGLDLNLLVDIFNMFNRQSEANVDQGYTLASQIVQVIDYTTGKELPAIKPGTPCTSVVSAANASSCDPNFGKTNTWLAPRSIRFGVRLTF